jgi:uncharacterized protein (TIGR03437 family)
MSSSFLTFCIVLAWPAWAQFTDLTAPGHGGDLYYALLIPQPIPDAYTSYPSAGPIYRVGSVPPALFASSPPPVFPPNGIFNTNTIWFLSPYYLISHPQFSRDGSVFAFMGKRVCLGGKSCITVTTTQTTVQGVPGQGTLTFDGKGWLSGNGRFLLIQPEKSVAIAQQPVLVDLQTGQRQIVPGNVSASPDSNGRVLADDGTAVLNPGYILRDGQLIQLLHGVSEPVIDAAAQTVIYTTTAGGSSPRYLRVYNIVTKQDSVFVQPNGDTYSPAISADGKRVMFLSTAQWGTSNPPDVTQLYTANLDGTGFQELTSGIEPTGVQQYTMSDDGQMAWHISGDGKLVKLDMSTGQPVRTVFRPAAVDLSGTLVPGSVATLGGAGLTDALYGASPASQLPTLLGKAKVILNGIPAPLLSVAPGGIAVQVPWEIQAGQTVTVQVVTNAGTPAESSAQAAVTPLVSWPSLIPLQGCTQVGLCGLGGGAIHHDWSGYVTSDSPALPGEILHFYGTGFGPVQPAVATGTPAPASPLAVVPAMPACTSDPGGPATVAYLGLAPGLVGYYQMDVQLPAAFSTVHPTENTLYDQFYIACGQGVTAVFAIKTTVP